jgi:hypothetical protein
MEHGSYNVLDSSEGDAHVSANGVQTGSPETEEIEAWRWREDVIRDLGHPHSYLRVGQ